MQLTDSHPGRVCKIDTDKMHHGAEGHSAGNKRASEDEWEVVDKAETLADSSYVGPATFADSVASQPASPAPGGDGVTAEEPMSMESAGVPQTGFLCNRVPSLLGSRYENRKSAAGLQSSLQPYCALIPQPLL